MLLASGTMPRPPRRAVEAAPLLREAGFALLLRNRRPIELDELADAAGLDREATRATVASLDEAGGVDREPAGGTRRASLDGVPHRAEDAADLAAEEDQRDDRDYCEQREDERTAPDLDHRRPGQRAPSSDRGVPGTANRGDLPARGEQRHIVDAPVQPPCGLAGDVCRPGRQRRGSAPMADGADVGSLSRAAPIRRSGGPRDTTSRRAPPTGSPTG